MLLGQESNVGWWVGAASVLAALFTGLGTLLGLFLKSRRESHLDSVRDYKELYLTVQKERAEDKVSWRKEIHDQRDAQHKEMMALQVQMVTKEKEAGRQREEDTRRCDDRIEKLNQLILQHEREKGEMRADIRGLQSQLRYVSSATGCGPTLPQPGVIVADVSGVVQVFSPSLTGFLGWMPADVQGQPITKLVAPAELHAHEEGMSAVMRGTKEIDPAKPLNVHVVHKDGSLVPVTIYLDGRMLKSLGLIVATMQERPAVAAPCPPPEKKS